MDELLDLAGKNALVTGAGRGAGQGIAVALARAGVAVAVVDLDASRGLQTVAEVEKQGVRAVALGADVSDEGDATRAVALAREALGPIHVGVNTVGNFGTHVSSPTLEHGWDFWQTAIDNNLKTTFFVSRALARAMIDDGIRGAIVNIASLSGLRGAPNLAPYGAVTAGVMHLTQSLALELAPHGIRVNCVGPTAIDGPNLRGSLEPPRIEAMAAAIPLGRLSNPEDVGRAVVMLASDLARFVTGQTLMCDGGLSCTTARPEVAAGAARPIG